MAYCDVYFAMEFNFAVCCYQKKKKSLRQLHPAFGGPFVDYPKMTWRVLRKELKCVTVFVDNFVLCPSRRPQIGHDSCGVLFVT